MLSKEERARLSGEDQTGGAPSLVLNQIRLNGKKGIFVFEHVKDGLVEDTDGKKSYAKTPLGEEIDVVFLKIRRKLVQFRKDEKPLSTSEHSHPSNKVTLWGNDKIEYGMAATIREKYPMLRTQQVIYGLYKGELVRIILKGASLGSDSKAKANHSFYSYIASFKKGADEHFYEYLTKLKVVEETSSLGSYSCATFIKGAKLNERQQEVADTALKTAADYCEESDAYNASKAQTPIDSVIDEIPYPEEMKHVVPASEEYPEEEINADDIPF